MNMIMLNAADFREGTLTQSLDQLAGPLTRE